jgi:hypothetical protein
MGMMAAIQRRQSRSAQKAPAEASGVTRVRHIHVICASAEQRLSEKRRAIQPAATASAKP